jgi:uncharacterized protein (DUF58 family)
LDGRLEKFSLPRSAFLSLDMFPALQSGLRVFADRWKTPSRDPEPGEVFLSQRRVFIIPTRAGMVFAGLLVLLFFGSVNYNLSLGFALTFLLAACALIDMNLSFRNLAHLHLSAGRARAVFAGDEAQFELTVSNRRKHDRYAIMVGFVGEDLPDLPQAMDIAANATRDVILACLARQRGWLSAPRVRLITRFPLGLMRAWSYWRPDAKVLIYPHPEETAPPLPVDDEAGSEHGRAGYDDFAGIRAYQAGDAMKHLAWRQIARVDLEFGGALVTKHFAGGSGNQLCLDYSKLPGAMDSELRLSRMTRWVLDAEARGLEYSFRLGEISFEAALGPAHQAACLRALALYESES